MKIYLQEIRWNKNFSVEQLARLSRVSASEISRIENGHRIPTVETICKLAKALKCKPCDLFECE